MKTLYTAKVQVTNGRDGKIRSDDGLLEARLAFPPSLGGDGNGTNPEQLFAAGYGACFGSTLSVVAKANGTPLTDVMVMAEVDINAEGSAFSLAVRFAISAKGADRATLTSLVSQAQQACPYACAIRNNVETTVVIVGAS